MKLLAVNTIYCAKWNREPGTNGPDDKGDRQEFQFQHMDVFDTGNVGMSDEEAQKLIDMEAAVLAPEPGEPINMPGHQLERGDKPAGRRQPAPVSNPYE